MESNVNISFGIDLGIASLGWSVVDLENSKIIDKGVYLFQEAQKAEERRENRGSRRRKKRKLHRLERIYQILEEKNIFLKNTIEENLLEKRITGIKEKIEMQSIINIIFYFARHRGYIPFDDKDERKSEIVEKLKEDGYFACEIQKEIYENYGKYRGSEYLIQSTDYLKELEKMLLEQSKYYLEIDEEFIKKIKDVITSKRNFWEGPGGPREDQLNKYGRYRNLEDLENYRKDNNYHKYLFEELIGECSIYKGEKKASLWNYYSEYFNFYNDIVNLRINPEELDETNKKYFEQVSKDSYKLKKESILILKEEVQNSKSVNYSSLFKKLFNVDFSNIYGYKKDKDGNYEIAKFEKFRSLKNKLEDEELIKELVNDIDSYNKAIHYIQISPNRENRYEILKDKLSNKYSDKLINVLSNCNLENRYHSFSEKALKKYLELMEKYNSNSSFIERNYKDYIKSDVEETLIKDYSEKEVKYINPKYIENIIASPATKKSLRKAISVLNKLFSKYGFPEYICIENTKELLSNEKQKEYEAKTLDNQVKRKNVAKKLKEQGYDDSEKNINKYMLLEESNFKCMYCDKDITVENCEIEHILPLSKTANDTFLNKTVSCTQCNSKKLNRTPYEFLSTEGLYGSYKARVLKNNKISDEKKRNLLFEQSVDKYEKSFKNRNLNDTAYATNELANQLNLFKKAYLYHNNGEFLDFKVLRIPGQFTGIIRKRSKLEKDRSLKYHHAVDATIVANVPKLKIGKLINMIQNEPDKYWKINNLSDYRENLYDELYLTNIMKNELGKADFSNTRMLQEIDNKKTGKLFDSNISKIVIKNGEYYKIGQINNIYDLLPKDIEKNFKENVLFLCKDNNVQLYNKLMKIVDMYKGKNVNPFVEYCKENNVKEGEKFDFKKHGIKQSDNPNSSVVIRLRFLTKVTNPYIVDTKKLPKSNKKNKKEALLMYDSLETYCTRIYKDKENGKLYFMPIYKFFIDSKGKINEKLPYYKTVFEKYVNKNLNEIEKYMDIYNNEYVRFETNKGEHFEGLVSGFHKTLNKIEIKNCPKSITSNTNKIEKIKSDILGLYNLNIM